uniref:Uncharacterized protein n=1 Tax=Desertifilum tharense IPPAS B-1220 TaxID=1781255 RepID=A0ACD5GU67_9CYAN
MGKKGVGSWELGVGEEGSWELGIGSWGGRMEYSSEFANLVASVQSALGLIDFESNASLRQDALNLCDYLADPVFRIAVFR